MNLVILAAGQGTRLGDISDDKPKSLVEIAAQKPYLFYELEAFAQFAFSRRIIVGGFCFDLLRESVEAFVPGQYEILNNPDYKKGNLYTLLTAQNQLNDGFYLFNADHYYSMSTYRKIFGKTRHGITVFCDHDRNLTADDMKVRVNGQGHFLEMAKTLQGCTWGYVGVTFVPRTELARYWQACAKTAQVLGEKANVESVINHLAKAGHSIAIEDISGSWWTEIDTPEDHQKACATIRSHLK